MKHISVNVYISILAGILITCFTFVAVNKLLQPEIFRDSLLNQPLPLILQVNLPWLLPVLFLLNALLLTWQQVRSYGFILAFALFLAFTLYTSLILTHYFDYIPCTCGGISEALFWKEHLLVNISLLILALIGWVLEIKIQNQNSS